jgi:AraC-like DNA-binding protein
MDQPPLAYAEFAPGAAVQDLVVNYWSLTVRRPPPPAFRHPVWPDGCVQLTVALADGRPAVTSLLGPGRDHPPVELAIDVQLWGIRFRPDMGPAALRRSAASLRDQAGPAHHWLGVEPVARLERALQEARRPADGAVAGAAAEPAVGLALDRWLFDAADTTHPPAPAIRDAVRVIAATGGAMPIATVASLVGLSMRHLQRGFKEAVGLSPKEYALLRRRQAVARAPDEVAREVRQLLRGASDALRQQLATLGPSTRTSGGARDVPGWVRR